MKTLLSRLAAVLLVLAISAQNDYAAIFMPRVIPNHTLSVQTEALINRSVFSGNPGHSRYWNSFTWKIPRLLMENIRWHLLRRSPLGLSLTALNVVALTVRFPSLHWLVFVVPGLGLWIFQTVYSAFPEHIPKPFVETVWMKMFLARPVHFKPLTALGVFITALIGMLVAFLVPAGWEQTGIIDLGFFVFLIALVITTLHASLILDYGVTKEEAGHIHSALDLLMTALTLPIGRRFITDGPKREHPEGLMDMDTVLFPLLSFSIYLMSGMAAFKIIMNPQVIVQLMHELISLLVFITPHILAASVLVPQFRRAPLNAAV